MNLSWQTYLAQHGAHIDNQRVSDFGHPAQEIQACKSATVICDLSHFELIEFSGHDSQVFLQGQLSNDVKKLVPGVSQHSSYCTPKGRMLASFLMWSAPAGYLMLIPAELRESIQRRLNMFIMRSKVKARERDDLVTIGVAGSNAASLLQKSVGDIPAATLGVIQHDETTLIRLSETRFMIVNTAEKMETLWASLSCEATPVGASCWGWFNVRDGIPVITTATQEQFVPQMVNFEIIDGVSFKKGCYPGQEIVARMQYLGKLKRRMYLANIASNSPVAPGDQLFSNAMEDQSSGMVVNAALSPDGGYDVLAVIQISSVETDIHWKTWDGPVLQFMPLPYIV